MTGLHKFSLKTAFTAIVCLAFCCVVTVTTGAGNIKSVNVGKFLTADTIPLRPDSSNRGLQRTLQQDSNRRNIKDTVPRQKVDTFSYKISKDTLDAPVNYEAEDSAVVLADEKKIILYGKTKTTYKDVVLTAPRVELDQATNLITAYNLRDSLGEVVTRARFEQGENKFESDTIQYNFKSQKGLTRNTFTSQGEMIVHGEVIKKTDANTVFVKRGMFTTCDLDEPHFGFRANKLKIINNKVAVSGPMHPEFEDVPVPIYLPFGFYPLSKGRHSGLLPPQFTSTENSGLGLQGLGYYKVLNDNFDLLFRGDLYSYGGWAANLIPSYRVRYRYSGSVSLSVQNSRYNFRGDPDFRKLNTFHIGWAHSVDQRARPGVSFSANVSAGSTKHNEQVLGDANRNFDNNLTSSISYSKTWKDRMERSYNFQLAANHNQNSVTRAVDLILPVGSFSTPTFYPLAPKGGAATGKWYEKLGIGYHGDFRNETRFYDSAFTFNKLTDELRWGMSHSIPLDVTLPSSGPLLFSPIISYQENWMMKKNFYSWNETEKRIDTTEERGFYTARSVSFGINMNTALFGTYQFRNSKILAIRHTIRPNIGLSYSPNLARDYHRTVQIDSTKKYYLNYSVYEQNIYRGFSNVETGGITFGVGNSIEMKVRSTKDSAAGTKKIRILDNLSINSSYNFLQDTMRLAPFQLSASSSLFDKIAISAGGQINPYQVNEAGLFINKYVWEDRFSLGTLMSGSISMSTSFKSKPRDPQKKSDPKAINPRVSNDPSIMGDQQNLLDYMRRNPAEFVDFNIPYDLSLGFALSFNKYYNVNERKFVSNTFSSLTFRNSFSLTPKWNFSTDGVIDVKTKKLQVLTMNINREMHCWQMSIGVTPVGYQRYFNISISPKSSLLQNLKVNRTRIFNDF
jgi:LPS-assembly protein